MGFPHKTVNIYTLHHLEYIWILHAQEPKRKKIKTRKQTNVSIYKYCWSDTPETVNTWATWAEMILKYPNNMFKFKET